MTTKRAGVLARVSTAEQATEGYSIAAQIEKGKAYANLHDWEVVDVYSDGGVSGAKGIEDRPEAARFIKDARAGIVEVAIFTKLDRFSRSTKQALNDFDLLEELGVEIVFIEDNLDTTMPMGRAMRDLMLTFATLERETIRDRNMQGRYTKAQKGAGWATGRIPFGYEVGDDGHLAINEDEAKVIRLLFAQRAAGRSLRTVADRLNRDGFRPREQIETKTGEPKPLKFTAGSISHYVKNTAYRGDPIVRYLAPMDGANQVPFEFPVPAIVDDKVWAKANSAGAAYDRTRSEGNRTYGLGGRIWHEHHSDGSQATMFGHARRTGRGSTGDWLRIYRCADARAKRSGPETVEATCDGFGKVQGVDTTAIQADWIEASALLFMLDMLSKPEELEALMAQADETILGELLGDDPDDIRIDLAKLGVKAERWAEQYAEGIIDKPTRDNRIEAIMAERAALEIALAKIQAAEAKRAQSETSVMTLTAGLLPLVDVEDYNDLPMPVGTAGSAVPPRGTSLWWQMLRAEASKSANETEAYGRSPVLSPWVVKETQALAEDLDLHVILSKSRDPRKPTVRVALAPAALRGKPTQGTASSRGSSAYMQVGYNGDAVIERTPQAMGFAVTVLH